MGAGCTSKDSADTKNDEKSNSQPQPSGTSGKKASNKELPLEKKKSSDNKPEKVTEKISKNVSRRNSSLKFVKIDLFSNSANFMEKYEFLSVLGNGKFGKVKLYRDKKLTSMKYAIKTLLKKDYLLNEIKSIKNLDHPNIVKYFESYEEKHQLHIVMEYVLGENLTNIINRRKENKFNEKNLAEITKCLLKILSYLFSKQIIHKDLKPENILFPIPGKIILYNLIYYFRRL